LIDDPDSRASLRRPLFGSERRTYLEESIRDLQVELTPADLEEIDEAAPKGGAAGERYTRRACG
jgi:hypothetical protein